MAKTLKEKKKELKAIAEDLKNSSIAVVADYTGLDSVKATKLRDLAHESGAKFLIAKNTLFERAFSRIGVSLEELTGQNALYLGFNDPIESVKKLFKFMEEEDILDVKWTYFEGRVLDKEGSMSLKAVPERSVLLARLVSGFNSPLSRLALSLSNPKRSFVSVLSKIAEDKK